MSTRQRQAGFTLVELLVVITIISILMGMLIPAANSVRERGRQTQCSNNLHQLSIASLAYESRFGYLPMNWGVDASNQWGTAQSGGYSSNNSSSNPPANTPPTNSTANTPASPPRGYVSANAPAPAPSAANTGSPPPSDSSNQDQADASRIVGHSWIALILSDLDAGPLYQQIKFGAPLNYSNTMQNKDNQAASQQVLGFLRCPSDSALGSATNQLMLPGQLVATTNYKASCGSNWPVDVLEEDNADAKSGASSSSSSSSENYSRNTVGVKSKKGRNAGRSDAPDYCNGPMCRNRSVPPKRMLWTTSMANLTDGPSKTILYGEAVPAWSAFSTWYWWNGAIATCGLPLNYKKDSRDPNIRETMATDYLRSSGFMSKHPGGAEFVFADGHTKWIANGISPDVYRALGTIDGQESVSDDY